MPYVVLVLGVLTSLYAGLLLARRQKTRLPEASAGDEAFAEALSHRVEAMADTGLLYDLKERVEAQLAEINQQKELVTHLMMKVEKKLEREEGARLFPPAAEEPKEDILALDNLERARFCNDIYLLYDQGVPLVEIARQLGRGKGDIQLVLGLRN